MMALKESQGITTVIRIPPPGTINVYKKYCCNLILIEVFPSAPIHLTDIALHRAASIVNIYLK